jgi:hypothetical protein
VPDKDDRKGKRDDEAATTTEDVPSADPLRQPQLLSAADQHGEQGLLRCANVASGPTRPAPLTQERQLGGRPW